MIRIFGGGKDKEPEKTDRSAAAEPPSQPVTRPPAAAPPLAAEAAAPPAPEPVQQQPQQPAPKSAAARRVMLADDSPHAQRMGERILREVGYEVITVTDGETALMRLADADPDVVLADASLPGRSGYDICQQIKQNPRYSHVRVVLTAGLLEAFDDRRAEIVRADGVLKKPFESTVLTETVAKLAGAPRLRTGTATPPAAVRPTAIPATPLTTRPAVARPIMTAGPATPSTSGTPASVTGIVPVRVVTEPPPGSVPAEIDPERVRAAVTLALDSALPGMIDKITERVLIALKQKNS